MKKNYRTLKNPPEYDPTKWVAGAIDAGCYPYVIDNIYINKFLLIGDFLGDRCTSKTSNETLVVTLLKELRALGYRAKLVDSRHIQKKEEILIYLKREVHTGFYHFYRKDKDGEWSHKDVGQAPARVENFYEKVYVNNVKREGAYGWMILLEAL